MNAIRWFTRWISPFRLDDFKIALRVDVVVLRVAALGIGVFFGKTKNPVRLWRTGFSGKIGFLKISGYNAALFTPRVSFGLLSTLPGMPSWQYHALRIKPAPSHPSPLKRTIPMARATVAVRIEMECDSEFIEVECECWNKRTSIVRQ
jgi:hypothetical protein